MAAIRPESLNSNLSDDIFALIDHGVLFPRDDAKVLALSDAIDRLSEAEPDAAARLRGYLLHLSGDLAGALKCFASLDGLAATIDQMCVLANLGRQEDALHLFQELCVPEKGQFSTVVPMGACVGAFRTLASHMERARQMKLTNLEGLPLDELGEAAAIMERAGVRDEDVARALSVAGRTLVDYGFTFVGAVGFDAVNVPGEASVLRIRLQVATSPNTATALYLEFLDRLDDEGVPMPSHILISFEGVQA
jgi:hypothetical protein